MPTPMMLGEPEASYVRKFFDVVDKSVTQEMQAGVSLLEESLTFVLARLLDSQSTFQRVLDYPIDLLNADLEACVSGVAVSVEFETNEHKKSFEAAISYADLGIVIRWEGSVLGPPHTKALIVQSKKLYQTKGSYSVHSGYDGFDPDQYKKLKAVASKYDLDCFCYFLYNPSLDAFPEPERRIIQAAEAKLCPAFGAPYPFFPYWHPDIEFLMHRFFRGYPAGLPSAPRPLEATTPDQLREERKVVLRSRPGVRVLGITSVGAIVESNKSVRKSFRLEECYGYAFSDHWWHNSGTVPFLPLSSFIVDLVLGCHRGSANEAVIRIAEGREPEPAPKVDDEGYPPGLAVRHTIRLTLRSTLPQMDLSIRG